MADWLATGGPRYYRSPVLADLPEVVHGFFTRQGGVSAGAYHSLNVSLAVGDGQEQVAENLDRMRQALGLARLAGAAQVHGGRAAVITSPDQARACGHPGGGHPGHHRPRSGPAHQAGGLPGGDVL